MGLAPRQRFLLRAGDFFLPALFLATAFFAAPFFAAPFFEAAVFFAAVLLFFDATTLVARRAATFTWRRAALTTRLAVRLTARRVGAGTARAIAPEAALAADDVVVAALSATCEPRRDAAFAACVAVLITVPTALPTTSADRVSMSSAGCSRSSAIRPPLNEGQSLAGSGDLGIWRLGNLSRLLETTVRRGLRGASTASGARSRGRSRRPWACPRPAGVPSGGGFRSGTGR